MQAAQSDFQIEGFETPNLSEMFASEEFRAETLEFLNGIDMFKLHLSNFLELDKKNGFLSALYDFFGVKTPENSLRKRLFVVISDSFILLNKRFYWLKGTPFRFPLLENVPVGELCFKKFLTPIKKDRQELESMRQWFRTSSNNGLKFKRVYTKHNLTKIFE